MIIITTIQEAIIYHLWKRKNHLQNCLFRGYVSSQEVSFYPTMCVHTTTRWAPTNYKWSYSPYKWPYKLVSGVITLLGGLITPLITSFITIGSGPTFLPKKVGVVCFNRHQVSSSKLRHWDLLARCTGGLRDLKGCVASQDDRPEVGGCGGRILVDGDFPRWQWRLACIEKHMMQYSYEGIIHHIYIYIYFFIDTVYQIFKYLFMHIIIRHTCIDRYTYIYI